MTGSSGRQRVDVNNLKSYEIKVPDDSTIGRFNDLANDLIEKMKNNNNQIRNISNMRDTLLTELMNKIEL